MDAVEATYQNLPIAECARDNIEKEKITFDDATNTIEVVAAVEDGSSFEELLSSMLEVNLDASPEVLAEENVDIAVLPMEVVAEDAILDFPRDKFLEKNVKTENISIENQELIVENVEAVLEDVPFVEFELDVGERSDELKILKEVKTKDENKVSAEIEDDVGATAREEDVHVAEVLPFQHKRAENQKKDENRKEDKIEEKADVEPIEINIYQKKDKVKSKKLPIVVEDLRTLEEVKIGEAGGESFIEDDSNGEFPSYYKSSGMNGSTVSEASALNEGQSVQPEGQLASILAEQIKASSAELVERGRIVLQDGNIGEIRLQLKPAHLGSVKIQLKMSGDKKMQGEVTVSSKEAFDAFEESMQDLVASFNEAGFDASGFNLNWKGGQNEDAVREDLSNQYFSPEKTHLSLSEGSNFAENIHGFDQAKRLNVLA